MKWIALVCLLASAAAWVWALSPRQERPRPGPGLEGTYRFYRFEPPAENRGAPNPIGRGSSSFFDFRPDGRYLVLVFGARREIARREGFYEFDGRVVTLRQASENRTPAPGGPDRYRIEWKEDAEGKFLILTHDPTRHQLYLRPGPVTPEPVSSGH